MYYFSDPELEKSIPYGVYDITSKSGFVSVRIMHDTATFAVETIRRWWYKLGQEHYLEAKRLIITCDGGG